MAGTKYGQQSSSLVTFGPNTLLKISILVFVIYVVNIEGQSIDDLVTDNLRVNEGDSAVLPCFFSPSNAAIDKWFWKTNGSFIIRSDDPPDPNSRYSLGDTTSGNVSLVIKEVLRWDKGTYTCGVNDQSTGSTDDCKLRVNYLDNPKVQALADTRVSEGSRVSMLCKTNSSSPEVNMITWFHEGNIIDRDPGNYIFEDDILQIKEFGQSYEGNYSCRVENEFFTGRNGKYSNSITFSLLRKEAIPPSSSNSQIWIVFIIIPVLMICVVVLASYFWEKRSENIDRLNDFICKTVIRKDQKNEINVERTLDDFIPAEYKENGYEEDLIFKDSMLTVERGDCIKSCFISTYNSEHFCFNCRDGYHEPFFTMLLHSCNWPENRLRQIYSSADNRYRRGQTTGKFKDNGSRGSIEFSFELKKNVKYGATGYLLFNDVTDDDEGYYIYLLQIKTRKSTTGAPEEIAHAFYGRTSIQLRNAIFRSNVDKRQFISPIGVVISANQVDAFALKMEKEERKGQEEDKTILRYITCAGKPQSDDKSIIFKWNDAAKVLLKPEEELLSFVALPGLYHSYIFLAYINVLKDRRLLGRVFSFLPDGSYTLINNIVEKLESEGPVDVLKFDPFSGKKLSNGRLVVGGWIKHGYQKRTRMDILKLRFTGSTSSRNKLEDVENQPYEYEPFIMWTDDEINWNLGGNLKIEEAVENMRIQVTETDNGKEVVVIISSLDSKKVLYEGHSKDYCATFTETTKDWHFKMPVVSFAIINGSLVGASSMEYIEETSGQQEAVSSAKEGERSSANKMEESLLEIDEPANEETRTSTIERPSEDTVELSFQNVPKQGVSGKAASKVNKTLSFSSRKPSTSKSAHKYESVPTIEIPSIKNDDSMVNVIKEGSPETNELTDDEKVSTLEKLPQDSMEGSSGNVKKRRSLGNFGRILADRFPFSSKKASSVSEQTIEPENVSLTQECTLNKEGSTKNTKTEDSSGTYKLTDNEQVMATMEEPPEDSMEESSEKLKKRSSLGIFGKNVSNKLPTKSKGESSGSKLTKDSESASLTDEFIKEESTGKTIREGSSESNKLPEDEQVMATLEEPPEYSMEYTSERVVKKQSSIGSLARTVSNKLLTKLKRESPGIKLTKKSEIKVKSQIQDRSTWEGFWHLEEETTNDKAIRLRPVKDNKGSSDTAYDFVTILENRSKVQCEQILPFTCKDESWFVMIYSTHFINDKDEKSYSLCTRYHVFSLDKIMGGI